MFSRREFLYLAAASALSAGKMTSKERVDRAHSARLLARVQVEEAPDLSARVHLAGLLFEAADEDHLEEELL